MQNLEEQPSKAENYIPQIDISHLVLHSDWNTPEAKHVINQIDQACRVVGFFSIINHSIDDILIEQMLKQIRWFFHQSQQQKMKLASNKWNSQNKNQYRGYFPSTVNGKQGFDIHDPCMLEIPEQYRNVYYYEVNNLPKQEQLQATVHEYYEKLHKLAVLLTKVVWTAFGKEQGFDKFVEKIDRPYNLTTLRFNYYPKHQHQSQAVEISKEDGAKLGCETHVDSGIFTILYQDSQGGLQVKNSQDQQWYTVPFHKRAYVVNTGKLLEILTNAHYKATQHRVLINYHERVSIPFFFQMKYDAEINPQQLTNEKTEFKKETYGQFLTNSLKKFKEYSDRI